MKALILAGGYGTRISEESAVRPKPMVEIGGKPILWHIMKIYSAYGVNEFVIAVGYKGYQIKEYFANYFLHLADVRFDLDKNAVEILSSAAEPWTVTVLDTGDTTMTGGRLKRVAEHLGDGAFCMTYGDCVADVDVGELIAFHEREGRLATLTAVQPPGRFGVVSLAHEETSIDSFVEKPHGDGGWVNGGFFVLEPEVIEYVSGDDTVWEREPLERLARDQNLSAYRHTGFWQPMDTLRDRMVLEEHWDSGAAPWKVWDRVQPGTGAAR
jgi:glucose-1-phosphate cytidylyltransferase